MNPLMPLDNHHHIVVKGETKFSWSKAQIRAIHYYEELAKESDVIVSKIARLFLKQIQEKSLYEIFRERYEEEFGSGRKKRPLPYYEGDFHCVLLLNPFIYKKTINKKIESIEEDVMYRALELLGPICSMASVSHMAIKNYPHAHDGFTKEQMQKLAETHWQLRDYIKTHTPEAPKGTETLKLSRMHTPAKALDAHESLKRYSYRGLGFGKTLINTVMFVTSILFPDETHMYLHARAGSVGPQQEGVVDKDWVVPFYENIGAKWITSIDGYHAFNNVPYINMVLRFSIVKNTGKLDHILLINDK